MSKNNAVSSENAKQNRAKTKKDSAWIVLGAICIIAALCLGIVNGVTNPIIAKLTEETAQNTRRAMLPQAASFEPVEGIEGVDCVWRGLDADMKTVGYVGEITVTGFGGKIVVTAGLDLDKRMTGISVGGSDFSETAGLGAKAKGTATESEHNEFLDQFLTEENKDASKQYEIVKSGAAGVSDMNDIDAITSATKTSNAIVTGNVSGTDPQNGGINKLCTVICQLIDQEKQADNAVAGTETAEQKEGVGE